MSAAGDQLRAAAADLENKSKQPWRAGMYDDILTTTAMMRTAAGEIDRILALNLPGISVSL